MKRLVTLFLALASACATSHRKEGVGVDVYETSAAAPAAQRTLPEGCRQLGRSGPIDQMESERVIDDPYKRQRREVAEKGGNVLLVLSERTVVRPNSDCPSGDASADCLRRGQSWYRVSFEQYACAPEAVAELKSLEPRQSAGGITLLLGAPKKATSPPPSPAPPPLRVAELKTKVLDMMRENVATEVILAYVKGKRLSRKMTAEEIIDWTRSGIPDAVIEAAASY